MSFSLSLNKIDKSLIIFFRTTPYFIIPFATSVSNFLAKNNVVDEQDKTTIYKQPQLVGPMQPLQMQPLQTGAGAQQSGQSNVSWVLGERALKMHNLYIVPNVRGMPRYFDSLLTAIIHKRNPMWDPSFDDGQGGFGLALITEDAGRYYMDMDGVDRQQLFDANNNVGIALQVLSRGRERFGDDVNKLVGWYILGDPNATDTRVQEVLELFKQLENK